MDLFDSKRQERLEAARKAATASKEAALAFLIRAGGCYWAGNKPALPVLTCFLRTARIDAST